MPLSGTNLALCEYPTQLNYSRSGHSQLKDPLIQWGSGFIVSL